MSDQQSSPSSPDEEPLESKKTVAKKAAKKATKKTAKKAAKKVAKKAAKKSTKKAAKKAVKKAVKKSAKKAAKKKSAQVPPNDLEPELPGLVAESSEGELLEEEEAVIEESPAKPDVPTNNEIERQDEGGQAQEEGESASKIKEVVEEKKDLPPPPPPPEVPSKMDVNQFRNVPLADLYGEIERLPLRIPARPTKAQLVFSILSCYVKHGCEVKGKGVLEMINENYGLLRDAARSFRPEPDDIYLSVNLIKEHDLRVGQEIEVVLRAPRGKDKYLSAERVLSVEGVPVADFKSGAPFDFLTSLFPEERFMLDQGKDGGMAVRVIDVVAPLGKGQRGLIVAPPRGGKTIILKQIAKSLQANHPETELIILLLDERPEEVTDFEDMVGQNVYASTFDEPSKRHAQVAALVLERARRLVEQGKDVVILLDSLTRLARGFNNASRGGPIGSGGISPKAITECRKFFGAARNVEEGGSLTILATCLVETESRMDDVIFEELKGTGNMEIRLDRILAEQRIYPAIHIPQSGTRNDDRLYHDQELPRILEIRRHLAALPIGEALEVLLGNLSKTESNTEFLLKGIR